MALSVDNLFKYTLDLIRKNQSGTISNVNFQNYFNAEQKALMSDFLGHFQRNNNSKTGLNTGLVQNQINLTQISPFIKDVTIVVTSGKAPKPSDFQYTLALQVNGKQATHVNHDQSQSVINSVIDPPSLTNDTYYYTEYAGAYGTFPSGATSITLKYISTPVDIVWGYTFDGAGRQIYAPTGGVNPLGPSVQSQWDDLTNIEIIKRMLKSIGVSLSAKDIENFGNSNVNMGD